MNWKAFQFRNPTEEQIREWDRNFRPTGWGVVTGKFAGVVVADFDGEEGTNLLTKWCLVPHVRTGSGGFHVYLQHPGWDVPTLNAKTGKAAWPWPGLDIRGDGGFAMLLGRNDKGHYDRLRELVPDRFECLPAELRDFLRNHSKKPADLKKGLRGGSSDAVFRKRVDAERLIDNALGLGNGRNNGGFWLACQLRDNGYSSDEAVAAMRTYRSRTPSNNVKGVREPYSEREMMASLRAAYSCVARPAWDLSPKKGGSK